MFKGSTLSLLRGRLFASTSLQVIKAAAAAGVLITPVFTGSTSQSGTTISLGLDVDATAAVNDVIDVRYRAVGSLTWIDLPDNTLDAGEAAPPYQVSFTTPDLDPDDYEFQAKHYRPSPFATSTWSASYTVTLSAASSNYRSFLTPDFVFVNSTSDRHVFTGGTMVHEEAA